MSWSRVILNITTLMQSGLCLSSNQRSMQQVDDMSWGINTLSPMDRTYLRLMMRMGNTMYIIRKEDGDIYAVTNRDYKHDRYRSKGGRIAFRVKPKYDYILPGYRGRV